MKNINKVWILMMCLVIISFLELTFVSAQIQTLSTSKINTNISLTQTVTNSTYCNLTKITYPNNTILNVYVSMTKNGNDYNYNYVPDSLGTYSYITCCNPDGIDTCVGVSFDVTPNGTGLSTGQSLIYVVLIIINLVLFTFCIYGGISVDGSNSPDEDGKVLPNMKKYLKIFFFFLSYIMLIWFSFNLWQLSLNFLQMTFTTNFFFSIWQILLVSVLPVTAIFLIFVFVNLFTDKKFRDMWERGIPAYRNYGDD